MTQDFKMDSRLAQDVINSMGTRKPEDVIKGSKTWTEFMGHVQAYMGMTGFSVLDPSREPELLAKIKELETERDKKADEYTEILGTITKEIESLKSDK